MGISKKLKMIKNNEYLIFKMKKTLLFFTAIINFIGFSFFVNAADVTINGSNSTDYTFDDGDTLTLKGPANASGKLNFNSGTISITSITDNLDQITGEVNTTSGTDIGIDVSNGNTLTISASIGGAGSIDKVGEGNLILNQSNVYTGTTTISDGTLQLNASGTLSDSTSVNVASNGTFDVNLTNTIASIEGSGIIDIASSTTLTAGDANDKEFSGVIQGAGNFSKSGSGTLTLSGTNTYTGSTTVSGGTLQLTGSLNNLTAVTVNSGASLDLQASQTIASLDLDGSITRSAGTSTLTVSGTTDLGGNVTTTGSQTYTGAATLSAANTLTTTNSNITFSDTVNSDGTTRNLTINAGTGTTQFAGIVGGTSALGIIDINGSLDLDAAIADAASLDISGTSNIGADVTTTGTQGYSGTTTLSGGDRTLTGSTINFGSTVDGGGNNIIIAGNADIDGAITNTAALSVQGEGSTSNIGADITTAGVQFLGNATLSGTGDRTVTSTGGSNITFYGITGASKGLTVDGGFQLSTNDATGLASLSVTGASTLAADVTSTGTQSYDGTTTLSSGDRTLNASTVTLNAVTGGSNALTVTGNLDLDGAVSGVTNMSCQVHRILAQMLQQQVHNHTLVQLQYLQAQH